MVSSRRGCQTPPSSGSVGNRTHSVPQPVPSGASKRILAYGFVLRVRACVVDPAPFVPQEGFEPSASELSQGHHR